MKFKKEKFDKQNDVSTQKTDEFCLPLVNAKDGNNGIMYYGRESDFESSELTIDIVNDGAVSTGNVYSQPQKTGVLYNAYLIRPFCEVTPNLLHFFACTIQKSIKLKFGYQNKAGWAKVAKEKIQLPTKDSKIDFEFMESFIAELEAQRIAELEAYLTVSGLDNYELSSEELDALQRLESRQWDTFNLEKLFGKATRGKRLKSNDRIDGPLPFVTAGEGNEGISAHIGNHVEVFAQNTTTIDMFGSAKYRNYEYGADDHIAVVHTEHLPQDAAVFITTAIHKSSHNGQFHYGKNFYAKDADALNIQLPTKDGKIDYEFMEKFISAIRKLVIKDVVLYADQKIAATKRVVASGGQS